MKIDKNINGDKYRFYVQAIPNKLAVNVKYFHTDEWIECNLTDDINWIILPENKFKFNGKSVSKLKLSKINKLHIMDYNNII
jgi:hypothetical protein